MSTGVTVNSFVASDMDYDSLNKTNTEIKSGSLTIISHNAEEENVKVMVHRTSLEHFMVIQSVERKTDNDPPLVLNLKNVFCEKFYNKKNNFSGIVLRHKGCDDVVALMFGVKSRSEIDSWILALTDCSEYRLRPCNLPVLDESDES